ncbi:zf-C2HC5-domain-containing protein [Morchella conica CCBAS932]|uniref:Zf-C2HC5-domain-containing protein n=1 Tax=Morchella conica CCBAS932 TaxID=1392247 RepID=A0A3N4L9Q1_9PEZI|nr:zf-C2HC5-domain-containing protein [Morchella conica CCBAS932]
MGSKTSSLQSWALPRLQPLLPLPEEDLLQVITYAASLSSAERVSAHFKDLLGEAPESLSFISEFNSRQFPQASQPTPGPSQPWGGDGPSTSKKKGKKGKPPIGKFAQAPRQVEDQFTNPSSVYIKKDLEDEYFTGSKNSRTQPQDPTPPAPQHVPNPSKSFGTLTSDLKNVKTKKAKPQQQKVVVTGGTSMRGVSKELDDLESALRTLEMSTNPTIATERRKCSCMGLKHEVFAAAPNCLSCGKVICIKEGLGPCTFCNTPLISSEDIQSMVRALRDERGKERMAVDAARNKRPEVAKTPKPFSTNSSPIPSGDEGDGLKKAMAHRDRLLGFQANNAQRTKIIDQAADFETPISTGLNPWANPQERALQLKKQQKIMRMMDWNAKEDYEKRRIVVAIDLKGRKIVKEMRDIAPPEMSSEEEHEVSEYDERLERGGAQALEAKGKGKGTERAGQYARNPLLKGMIRPVYDRAAVDGKGKGKEIDGGIPKTWRRVQDELKDNEDVILDGGIYGRERAERGTVGEEPACG